MKKNRNFRAVALAAGIVTGLAELPLAPPAQAVEWRATAAVATDYVERGVSRPRGGDVVQGSLNLRHRSGLWAGLFASNVEFIDEGAMFDDGADIEVDYSVGYGRAVGERWAVDVSLNFYRFPGARSFVDYDYRELRLDLDYRGIVAASVAYSDDYSGYYKGGFASNGRAVSYELGVTRPFARRWAWHIAAGHADLGQVVGASHQYWRAGVAWEIGRLAVDAGWYASDGVGRRVYGDSEAGGRFVVGVTATLP